MPPVTYNGTMKRPLVVLLGLLIAATALAAAPSTSTAAAPAAITGRLVDSTTGLPVVGTEVLLASGPGGSVIGSSTTDSLGKFSVVRTGPLTGTGSYVRVTGDARVQSGIVGGSPKWVQPSYALGRRYADGTALGTINALPSYVRGTVLDAATLERVGGAKVNLRRASDNLLLVTTTTASNGSFKLYPVRGEDFNLQVLGASVGYENGYRACDAQLVPTIGEACGSPLGAIGRVYADKP